MKMPPKIVNELCERVARLEEQVKTLDWWVKTGTFASLTGVIGILAKLIVG